MDNQTTKDVIKVIYERSKPEGRESTEVTFDRIKQETTLTINGKLVWGVYGKWAEKFFNKYGLSIN